MDWPSYCHVVWDLKNCVFFLPVVEVYKCLFLWYKKIWCDLDSDNKKRNCFGIKKLPRCISYKAEAIFSFIISTSGNRKWGLQFSFSFKDLLFINPVFVTVEQNGNSNKTKLILSPVGILQRSTLWWINLIFSYQHDGYTNTLYGFLFSFCLLHNRNYLLQMANWRMSGWWRIFTGGFWVDRLGEVCNKNAENARERMISSYIWYLV